MVFLLQTMSCLFLLYKWHSRWQSNIKRMRGMVCLMVTHKQELAAFGNPLSSEEAPLPNETLSLPECSSICDGQYNACSHVSS